MDKREIELARAGLDIYARELGPTYKTIRDELSLQLGTTSLNGIRERIAEKNANQDFLTQFTTLLPRSIVGSSSRTSDTYRFDCKDVAEARLLQSLVVADKFKIGWIPHYIIGRRSQESRRFPEQLLLVPAVQGLTQTEVRDNYRKGVENIEAREAFITKPYTQEELERMYDENTDTLVLNSDGSFSDFLQLRMGGVSYFPEITNQLLADFDVFTHLNRLATAFDVVEGYDELLNNFAIN